MNYLIFIFLLLIPTQLGRHFWPEWSLIHGIRIDYLSPTLYLIDIFALLIIISKITRNNNQETNKIQTPITKKQTNTKILLFVVFIFLNILVSTNKWVAVIAWLRVAEIWGVFLVLKDNKELVKKYLKYIIPFWIILQSGLGLLQVVKGGSVQGLFYWLGERRFNLNTIGIAKISILGEEFMRAYGTFSHPNSLAGFLLVVLELWKDNKKNLWYWTIRWAGIFGILICASRTAILLLPFYFWPVFLIFSGWDSLSLVKRMQLNVEAIKMIWHHPLFGVGLNNYLVNSRYYQPVHNVYLLILSQVGVVGTIMGAYWVKRADTEVRPYISRALWIILITGLVDHYWVTLPQNWWILLICLITN